MKMSTRKQYYKKPSAWKNHFAKMERWSTVRHLIWEKRKKINSSWIRCVIPSLQKWN